MSTLYSAATRRARGDGGLCGSERPDPTGGSGPVCVTTCDVCCGLDSTDEILFVEAAPLEEAGLFSFRGPFAVAPLPTLAASAPSPITPSTSPTATVSPTCLTTFCNTPSCSAETSTL